MVYPEYKKYMRVVRSDEYVDEYRRNAIKKFRRREAKRVRREAEAMSTKCMTREKTSSMKTIVLSDESRVLVFDKDKPVTSIVKVIAGTAEVVSKCKRKRKKAKKAKVAGVAVVEECKREDQPSAEVEPADVITVASVMRDAMGDEQENSDFSLGIDIEEQLQVEQLGEAIKFCEFVNQLGEPSPEEEPMAAGLGETGGLTTTQGIAARRPCIGKVPQLDRCYLCNASGRGESGVPWAMVDSGASTSIIPSTAGIRMQQLVRDGGVFRSFTGQTTAAEAKGTIPMWIRTSGGKFVQFFVGECHRLREAKHLLLSVSSLCDQLGAKFSFEDTGGMMTVTINGEVQEIPLVRYQNLYYLQWLDGNMSEPDGPPSGGVHCIFEDFVDCEENMVSTVQACDCSCRGDILAANSREPAYRVFQDMHELHCAFGHISERMLREMIKRGYLKVRLRSNKTGFHCEACALAKMHRQPVSKTRLGRRSSRAGELFYTDVKGKLKPDMFGNVYWIHFIDDFSGFVFIFPMKKKSDVPAIFKKFLERLRIEGFGDNLRFIQSDNGGEYTSAEMQKIFADEELLHRRSAPDTQAQNGKAERLNRNLREGMMANLNDAGLPFTHWSRSVTYFAYVSNRIFHRKLTEEVPGLEGENQVVMHSPYELFYGTVPDTRMIQKFGTTVYFWVPGATSSQNPGKKGIFIGVAQDQRAYLIAEADNPKKVHATFHVYFPKDHERVMRLPAVEEDEESDRVDDLSAKPAAPSQGELTDEPIADLDHERDERRRSERSTARSAKERNEGSRRGVEERTGPPAADTQPRGSESAKMPAMSPRTVPIGKKQPLIKGDLEWLEYARKHNVRIKLLQRNPKKGDSRLRYEGYKSSKTIKQFMQNGGTMGDLKWDTMHGFIIFDELQSQNFTGREEMEREQEELKRSFMYYCEKNPILKEKPDLINLVNATLSEFLTKDPKTTREAYNAPDAEQWKKAMLEEFESFLKMQVLERLTPEEAKNKKWKKIRTKWVYKKKMNKKTGEIERYKARLCAKGFTQREGIDYDEVFAPVFSYSTLRLILALAVQWDLRVDSFDLQNAFLQQDLDKDHIVIECPEGLDLPLNPDGSRPVFRLRKSLYGLKQSARLLSKRLAAYFIKQGFTQLLSDTCCFRRGEGADAQIVLVWVDDILFFSARDDEKSREEFREKLSAEFMLSPHTSGETEVALGINVNRDWENGEITINMPKMIENIATKFGCTDRPAKTPMSSDIKLAKGSVEDIVPASEFDYMSCVGALLYLALTVRPDIAYAVGQLSRFMSCPTADCVTTAKQCMNYLFCTRDLGITFRKSGSGKWRDIDEHGNFKNELEVYVDADYANSRDTAKSVSGFVLRFNGAAIDYQSKLQSLVAQSTSEAETYAACEVVKRTSYMRMLLHELGVKQIYPTVVYEDNDAVMSFVENYDKCRQTKHFLVKVRYLQQQEQLGIFKFKRVDSEKNIADTFTKALGKVLFAKFRSGLAMEDPVVSTRTTEVDSE